MAPRNFQSVSALSNLFARCQVLGLEWLLSMSIAAALLGIDPLRRGTRWTPAACGIRVEKTPGNADTGQDRASTIARPQLGRDEETCSTVYRPHPGLE